MTQPTFSIAGLLKSMRINASTLGDLRINADQKRTNAYHCGSVWGRYLLYFQPSDFRTNSDVRINPFDVHVWSAIGNRQHRSAYDLFVLYCVCICCVRGECGSAEPGLIFSRLSQTNDDHVGSIHQCRSMRSMRFSDSTCSTHSFLTGLIVRWVISRCSVDGIHGFVDVGQIDAMQINVCT